MVRSLALLSSCLAAFSAAAPVEKRQAVAPPGGDITILNYALTLEYLERKFYEQGLQNYTAEQFAEAGFDATFYANLENIYADEKTHVDFLAGALGDKAVGEPTFAFPSTDVNSFLGLSAVLEGVGVSAYLGAAASIADKNYLTAAGSILTVEARHASYIRAAIGQKPFPTPFDTPLQFNQVFSLAAQFVTGLPEGFDLPFKAFPALTAATVQGCKPNDTVKFTNAFQTAKDAGTVKEDTKVFAVFYSGLQTYYVPVTVDGADYFATIPGASEAQPAPAGQVYITLSTADGVATKAGDDNTVAGVAIIEI